jgi:PAS domain S-box-containing protein
MPSGFSLTKKILLLVSLFLAAQVLLFIQMETLSTQAERDFADAVRAKEFTDEINRFTEEFYHFTRVAYDAKPTRSEQVGIIDQMLSTLHALEKREKILQPLTDDGVEKQTVREAGEALSNAIQIATALRERLTNSLASAELDWSKGERSQFRKQLSRIRQVSTLGREAKEKMNLKFERQKQLRAQSKTLLTVSLLLVAFSTLLAARYLLARINQRINYIRDNIHRLAAGIPLNPLLGGADELAVLDANFQAMSQQLREAQRKEHALLNKSASLMCSLDTTGRFASVNPASLSIIGYEPDDLVGSHCANIVAKGDVEIVHQGLQNAASSTAFEATIIRKDESSVDTLWSVRPDQASNSVLCVIHDVTERKQSERIRKDLIALVTEELQYPLNTIKSFLDDLNRDRFGDLSQQGKRLLSLAMRSVGRMSNLVSDLLDAEKIKSGVLELVKREVAVSYVFESSVAPLQNWAGESGVQIIYDASELKMNADEERIGRVLTNLVSNAVKYSPRDSIVSIKACEVGDFVEIKVSDHGRGIPADAVDDLFKPFRQAKIDDRKIGTGLGLSICKDIVELHGGTISVASEEGRGSTFCFLIPKAARP